MISVFKTGVSSDPAQAGSIPVRLRYLALSLPAKQLRSGDLLTIPTRAPARLVLGLPA